ncbi:ferrochelatase [Psittacicella gerlachiana]|uniref:Ferrochelatase n=1 Tax=Psittacicella gerlachiana TaxID=2028574 RepID=A0A3A1YC43_9GAMM|nr:ferrochelatase [Psittacicella gerlachiana]RIY34946.1 ferrochelatase [Psittacicella gerlachiana]
MAKVSVILANLGTPDEPTAKAVSSYLGEFLSDPRVVDVSQPKWGIILRFIRFFRSPKVAKIYQSVWSDKGSPLLAISQAQRDGLQQLLSELYPQHQWTVVLGMTYGEPSLQEVTTQVFNHHPEHVILLPAYPQFSSTTVLPVIDAFNRGYAHKNQRLVAPFSIVHNYHLHASYIYTLAQSIREHIAELEGIPVAQVNPASYFHAQNKLFMSYHGIPTRYAQELQDPYPQQCEATTLALAQALGLKPEQYQMTYQSVFGKEPWLEPQTDHTLTSYAQANPGAQAMVICPGFAADCIETLEEIAEQNRDLFLEHGGSKFSLVPCLNAKSEHLRMFIDVLKPYIDLIETQHLDLYKK